MSDFDYEIANERVSRGIEWLDANLPDWREKVDPDRLSISSLTNCILGQCFAGQSLGYGYRTGFEVAFAKYPDLHGGGFSSLGLDTDGDISASMLTEVWRDRLVPAVV